MLSFLSDDTIFRIEAKRRDQTSTDDFEIGYLFLPCDIFNSYLGFTITAVRR